ncbi:pre-rRNA-processing protein esf2 [Asbolus verrucosus]|uniref:Activator of basal transcription 1 n=1 Tax=Asbolus verrucosus TaxID=1661398 RepID=A0A482VMB6_ASBVE|nr:pre-rRNA-processing protein esf2 [Asbolus verrucosus]
MVEEIETINKSEKSDKAPKRGIIYLSTIPPYMNVTKMREVFSEFGKVGRVYLQLADADSKNSVKKSKQKKFAKKFTEGWVEFERKSVAKKVAQLLNNTQVNTRKKSKQYDCIWNIKYLSNFKWTHLHERLAYEKAARRQKLRAEIQLAKKKTNFFTANLDKKKKDKTHINKELENLDAMLIEEENETNVEDRTEFLQSLFT